MKIIRFISLQVFTLSLPFSSAVRAQSQIAEQPRFRIEIQAASDGGPKFTVTNLSGKTLTAATFQFSVSSETKPQGAMSWDPIVQGRGVPGHEQPGPIEPGASLTMYLPHQVGGPLPDKVEVVAGIWEDGETFGQELWLKTLLARRASVTIEYEQAISLLQKGLDENWTRAQFLEAVKGKPNSFIFYSIRSTLEANPNLDQKPRYLQLAITSLLEHFTKNLALMRLAKSPVSDTARP
jgi:hypothetical protein